MTTKEREKLKVKIQAQIAELSNLRDDSSTYWVEEILRPMLFYIKQTEAEFRELARIGFRHHL